MKRLPRTLGTLLAAWLAAELCVWLGTPIPWMLGPLLITAMASMAGAPTHSANLLRNMGQWVIGTALGLYFTPQVSALVLAQWWAIVLAVIWALVLGAFFGLWLQRLHGAELSHLSPRALLATTYFSGSIGGASEMTMLAERHGARTDLVAAAHSMRLVMVVIAVPFGMQWAQNQWGLTVDASLLPGTRLAQWPGLLWLGGITALGGWVMLKMGRTNPWFMGPLVASMAVTLAGWEWSAVPTTLSNAAQLVIGVSLGIRFRREFVRTAPRWLASVAWGSALMMGASVLFGMALAWGTGLHPATMILGTAPGGITEMAITAKVLQLGVPVVTAFQVCRLVAVLLIVGPLFSGVARRVIKA